MNDRLQSVFDRQFELAMRYGVPLDLMERMEGAKRNGDASGAKVAAGELADWHRQIGLAVLMEASEFLDWSPWKGWSSRSGNKQVDEGELYGDRHVSEVKAEIADLFHFVVEAALIFGMSAQDLCDAYGAKFAVNEARQNEEGY